MKLECERLNLDLDRPTDATLTVSCFECGQASAQAGPVPTLCGVCGSPRVTACFTIESHVARTEADAFGPLIAFAPMDYGYMPEDVHAALVAAIENNLPWLDAMGGWMVEMLAVGPLPMRPRR